MQAHAERFIACARSFEKMYVRQIQSRLPVVLRKGAGLPNVPKYTSVLKSPPYQLPHPEGVELKIILKS